jgi:hypothetical protein
MGGEEIRGVGGESWESGNEAVLIIGGLLCVNSGDGGAGLSSTFKTTVWSS